ncbi:Translocation protein S62 [Entophlyctis luteolus]|nr:Translocation protein S62 [Entophlyctis luteolus]KAJ3344690.1 Translocation protein S62 [Entophlyctis luteolus]KAJ3381809.1 Translocation protein S62 [Entophlyctis sp. JEL0112]
MKPQSVLNSAPPPALEIAKYLRSSDAKLKVRQGVMDGRRVDFFKGKHAVNALLREPYKKSTKRPAIPDRDAGESHVVELLKLGFFIRVDRQPKSKTLTLQPVQVFSPDAYYVWIYESKPWWANLAGFGILSLIFAGVLFPLWPSFMRQGVYYLSLVALGLLGVFFGIAILRLIIWILLKAITGRGGWLFPNLFADVGVIESFIPTWEWDPPKGGSKEKLPAKKTTGQDEEPDDDE